MRVTAIKEQIKNPERVSVFIDGSFSFSLSLSQLLECGLKKDAEVTDEQLHEYKKTSQLGKRYMKLLNWATLRPRSTGELRSYIRFQLEKDSTKRLSTEEQDELTSRIMRHGYVDDERFAEWWVGRRTSQSKSIYVLQQELKQKGVSPELISRFVSGDNMVALAAQVQALRARQRYAHNEQKLIAALMRKGFRYSDVVAALEGDGA